MNPYKPPKVKAKPTPRRSPATPARNQLLLKTGIFTFVLVGVLLGLAVGSMVYGPFSPVVWLFK